MVLINPRTDLSFLLDPFGSNSVPVKLKLISPSHSRVNTALFYSQKPKKERGTSFQSHFQAVRRTNRAPVSGWQDHSKKPKPHSHSCGLPWHAEAAVMLNQILKPNHEILHRLTMGRTPPMEQSFPIRLKDKLLPPPLLLSFCLLNRHGVFFTPASPSTTQGFPKFKSVPLTGQTNGPHRSQTEANTQIL